MKRFFVVLLSLGLIVAFSTTVFAADAKFSGEYFLQGWYNKNASLIDKDSAAGPGNRGSSAFYTQRLRMGIDFQVAKGLTLQTRFDALDRKWMAARRTIPANNGWRTTDSEFENIGFETANVQFMTPIGFFLVGNQIGGQFGTPFNDYVGWDNPLIVYYFAKGPFSLSLSAKKSQDGAAPPGTPIGTGTDFDSDSYTAQFQYRWSTGGAGFQFTQVYSNVASTIYKVNMPFSVAFVRQKFGKIFVEDEALWFWGNKYLKFANPAYGQDVKNGFGLSNYFNINVDLSPASIGFMFVYSSGDDPTTTDKKEGGYHTALGNDRSFNPCLILFNEDYMRWMGNGSRQASGNPGVIAGNAAGIGTYFDNVWFYQVYGEFKATPKLNFGASFSYAYADEKPAAAYVSDKYGYEMDVTMKYKIYDNLEYMIGAAYLWTGDYFKGTNNAVKLDNNYLITHKLTLTF